MTREDITPEYMTAYFKRKAEEMQAELLRNPDSKSAKFWAETYAHYARPEKDNEPKELT